VSVYSPAFAGTKLYCLVTEAHRCEKLAQSFYAVVPGQDSIPQLLVVSPTLYRDATSSYKLSYYYIYFGNSGADLVALINTATSSNEDSCDAGVTIACSGVQCCVTVLQWYQLYYHLKCPQLVHRYQLHYHLLCSHLLWWFSSKYYHLHIHTYYSDTSIIIIHHLYIWQIIMMPLSDPYHNDINIIITFTIKSLSLHLTQAWLAPPSSLLLILTN